jgi:hypothetical protein
MRKSKTRPQTVKRVPCSKCAYDPENNGVHYLAYCCHPDVDKPGWWDKKMTGKNGICKGFKRFKGKS